MSERIVAAPANARAHERPPHGRPRPARPALLTPRFALVLACQACFGFAFSAFFLLPTFLATQLAASAAEIGLLATATSFVTVFLMIGMGIAVDRLGCRRLIIGGGLLMAAGSMAFARVDEMGSLVYALRIAQAVAFAMVYVAGSALTAELAPDERLGEALGYFGLTGLAMNAVAPAAIEELAAGPGWPAAFALAAFAALACGLLGLAIRDGKVAHTAQPPASIAAIALRADQRNGGVVMACIGAAFAALFIFHQLYALELGIERVRVFFISYAIGAVVTRLGFGSLGDRWGRRRVSILSLGIYTLAAFAMMELASFGLGVIGAAFGLAHGIFYPTFSAMVVEPVESHERGKALALLQAWFNVGVALAASALGMLAEIGGYRDVFAIAGLCCAVATAMVVFSGRRTKPLELATCGG
jgi:MFS family permease